MDEKELQQLFRKYLDGKCSEDEKELLDRLFDSYAENQERSGHLNIHHSRIKKEMFSNIRKGIRKQEDNHKNPISRRWL
ncbi:hypothetical protein, partial [Sinomicrobium weinanense]